MVFWFFHTLLECLVRLIVPIPLESAIPVRIRSGIADPRLRRRDDLDLRNAA